VEFNLNYGALLSAMTSPYVAKRYFGRLVTGAAGRMVGGGVRSPAGFAESARSLRAGNRR